MILGFSSGAWCIICLVDLNFKCFWVPHACHKNADQGARDLLRYLLNALIQGRLFIKSQLVTSLKVLCFFICIWPLHLVTIMLLLLPPRKVNMCICSYVMWIWFFFIRCSVTMSELLLQLQKALLSTFARVVLVSLRMRAKNCF